MYNTDTITVGPERKKGEWKWRGRQIDIFAHAGCSFSDPNPDLIAIQGGKKWVAWKSFMEADE
jgi:hypothetical protein